MKEIFASEAPRAVGPFSHAMLSNGFLYCSGQVALNPETMKIEGKDIEQQTLKAFENIKSVLKSKKLNLGNIVKVNVYLTDMADFSRMNAVYEDQFGLHKPARTTIGVTSLPLNALIEMECIAECNES